MRTQLAMVGARARDYYDKQAKERQKARKGNQPGTSPVNLPDLSKGDARDHVGKAIGVSGKSIDYATKVLKGAAWFNWRGVGELAGCRTL